MSFTINNINISYFIIFTSLLFLIGTLGIFIIKQNLIIILMSIELMLLSVNLNFIFFSIILDDIAGQIMSICILSVAGAEASVGLAILILFYRIRGVIATDYIISLKG